MTYNAQVLECQIEIAIINVVCLDPYVYQLISMYINSRIGCLHDLGLDAY